MNKPDFDDDESYLALLNIAAKLRELDQLYIGAWDRFPKHVREMIDKIDPNEEMSPNHWSKQFQMVAEAVAEESLSKQQSKNGHASKNNVVDEKDFEKTSLTSDVGLHF